MAVVQTVLVTPARPPDLTAARSPVLPGGPRPDAGLGSA